MEKYVYNPFTDNFDKIAIEYPKYYIKPSLTIELDDYEQYVIAETRYIEIEGILSLGIGGMLIIL